MNTMVFEIVTAERIVYSDTVAALVAPGVEGELGILPNHTLFLTILSPGEIRVIKNNEESHIAISGGFMEVIGNKVTILADTAERIEEIDLQRAEEAMKHAQDRIKTSSSEMDLERAMASFKKSQARVKVARRTKRSLKGI